MTDRTRNTTTIGKKNDDPPIIITSTTLGYSPRPSSSSTKGGNK